MNKCLCGCGKDCYNKFAPGHHMKVLYKGKNNPAKRAEVRLKLSGKNHHNWKGGTRVVKGYEYTHYPLHPNSNKMGYILTSHMVMELKIGRLIKKNEVVHHKDHNRLNNDINNLELMDKIEHYKFHTKITKRDKLGRFLTSSEVVPQ
jgi:hypothetical protein